MKANDKIQGHPEISIRLQRCCASIGAETIADLIAYDDLELLKYRNFGKRTLGETRDIRYEISKRLNEYED